jgi:hypothetical protein
MSEAVITTRTKPDTSYHSSLQYSWCGWIAQWLLALQSQQESAHTREISDSTALLLRATPAMCARGSDVESVRAAHISLTLRRSSHASVRTYQPQHSGRSCVLLVIRPNRRASGSVRADYEQQPAHIMAVLNDLPEQLAGEYPCWTPHTPGSERRPRAKADAQHLLVAGGGAMVTSEFGRRSSGRQELKYINGDPQ